MSLLLRNSNSTLVFSDLFVVNDKEGYHFNGVTLTPQDHYPNDFLLCHYTPNNFLLYEYFALGNNQGIGVTPTKIAFLVDGQESIVIGGEFREAISMSHFWRNGARVWFADSLVASQKMWSFIENYLNKLEGEESRDARHLYDIMQRWKRESESGIDKAQKTIRKENVDIYAVGHQWIGYNWRSGYVAMGYGDEMWGETSLRFWVDEILFDWVSPTNNGWFVTVWYLRDREMRRYFLRYTNGGVQVQPVSFPVWEWEKVCGWTVWQNDRMVLSPAGRLLVDISPRSSIAGVTEKFVFLLFRDAPYQVHLIDHEGMEQVFIDSTYYPFSIDGEKGIGIYVGNHTALFSYCHDNWRFFSFIDITDMDITDKPISRIWWTTRAFPASTKLRVYVIRENPVEGKPDAFVIAFAPEGQDAWHICYLDARRRACLMPVTISDPDIWPENNVSGNQANEYGVVEFLEIPNKDAERLFMWMTEERVYVRIGQDVTLSGDMVYLPEKPDALWNYLRPRLWCSSCF